MSFWAAPKIACDRVRLGMRPIYGTRRSGQEALGVRAARLQLVDAEDQARLLEAQAGEVSPGQRRGRLGRLGMVVFAADIDAPTSDPAPQPFQFQLQSLPPVGGGFYLGDR